MSNTMKSFQSFNSDNMDSKKKKMDHMRDKQVLYFFYPLQYHLIKNFWKLSSTKPPLP